MRTVVETPSFLKLAGDYWNEAERLEFVTWLAVSPKAGDVIRDTGGLRKVRWSRPGSGKRSGVRVIYFHRPERGELWLLLIYAKNVADTIPAHLLRRIREEIER